MRYTVYIIRCLRSGTHYLGVTQDLSARLEELRHAGGWRRLAHPELLHIEQHDHPTDAHKRLQDISHRWRNHSVYQQLYYPDLFAVTPGLIGGLSSH